MASVRIINFDAYKKDTVLEFKLYDELLSKLRNIKEWMH